MKLTYCNPLSIADIPYGNPLDYSLSRLPALGDYRSISDPSVVYHDGKWILYPSYRVAYVTEDFVHWKHVDIGVSDMRYSPAIAQFKGKWYLQGHGIPEMYVADSPTGPFTPCGVMTDCRGNPATIKDSCLLADGDHLYMYWPDDMHKNTDNPNIESYGCKAVELDPNEPWKMLTDPVDIYTYDPDSSWQPWGEDNQCIRKGYLEGMWAYKRNGRYYVMIASGGTQYSSYANGVLMSDSPLSGYKLQEKHDPVTLKNRGLVRGAGHGCIVDGPNDSIWVFYTCIFNYNHRFERRIAMDPLGVDENGELYCPATTETPQFAPGVLERPELGNSAGLLPINTMIRPEVSSEAPGRTGLYAVDNSVLTWWQPAAEDLAPTAVFPFAAPYQTEALRIVWRDIDMKPSAGIDPGPFRYVVEYAKDKEMTQWEMLIDASENTEDLCIDYRQFDAVRAWGVRLRILGAPLGIAPGVVDLTAFGLCDLH